MISFAKIKVIYKIKNIWNELRHEYNTLLKITKIAALSFHH